MASDTDPPLLHKEEVLHTDMAHSSGQEVRLECNSLSVLKTDPPPPAHGLIVFEPEEIETEAFFVSKSMELNKDWFIWVLGEKNLFSQFLCYLKTDPVNMDRVLFYETFEFLEDILSEQIESYAQLRQETQSFSLQTFVLDDFKDIRTNGPLKDEQADTEIRETLERKKELLNGLRIPNHLQHHVTRIYDFYFGAESPMRFSVKEDTKRQIQSEYISGQTRVTWLDEAVQEILHHVFTEVFPGFVKAVREIVDLFQIPSHALLPSRPHNPSSEEGNHMITDGQYDVYRIPSRRSLSFRDSNDGDWTTLDRILAGYDEETTSSVFMQNEQSAHFRSLPRYRSQVSITLVPHHQENGPKDEFSRTSSSSILTPSELYKEIRAPPFWKRLFKRSKEEKASRNKNPVSPLTAQLYFDPAGLVLLDPV